MYTKALVFMAGTLMAGTAFAAPVQWSSAVGGNDHWYEFVVPTNQISVVDAEAAAESSSHMGLGGYLATITSAAEQAFLNGLWPGQGSITGQFNNYSYFLIGGSDRDQEGTFTWIGGPEEGQAVGYTNWAGNEPNNNSGQGTQEQYILGWWQDSTTGHWNDALVDTGMVGGYLVEYSIEPVSAVPLPGGAPLVLAGIGAFGLLRRRRGS